MQKRRQLERDFKNVTEEMYRRNQELADTNKALSLLRNIDALVLEPHASLKMVCEHIVEAIGQATEYPFLGIMTRSTHGGAIILRGVKSSDPNIQQPADLGFSRPLQVNMDHPWFSDFKSTALIDLTKESDSYLADLLNCRPKEIGRITHELNIKSLYIIKLLARRQIVGLLVVGYLVPASQLGEADVKLFEHLSESIGVALDNKLLFDENQRAMRQIKESNTKLLALDEAKDNFISMASHQLRTPLTSVKGYLSMVMEGDAGEITEQQQKLLKQAFGSSQRMVYIIADLLNVSRLRTGKFVMEATPVNLADMVDQELSQLEDTAESHKVKLIYKKPKNFPELMLDDTKTRQIIMNFVDNAIYYTPAGGKIVVSLENKPTTVEFRVKDNGIGVPKSEQHHLFTKFYRAANARQTRPDGTGLGLFMAKKVIVAQHGSLIFDSKENQGSTFGFIMNKSKLTVPKPETKATS